MNVIEELNENIIGIDFMHQHQLHYDVQTRQVKIAGVDIDQIVAIKEQTLSALSSTVITAKRYDDDLTPGIGRQINCVVCLSNSIVRQYELLHILAGTLSVDIIYTVK